VKTKLQAGVYQTRKAGKDRLKSGEKEGMISLIIVYLPGSLGDDHAPHAL
jgi:hypothetical protein